MSSKQKTLFQTWGGSLPPDTKRPQEIKPKRGRATTGGKGRGTIGGKGRGTTAPARQPPPVSTTTVIAADEDDDDDVLLVAVYEAEKSLSADTTKSHGQDPYGVQPWHQSPTSAQPMDDPGSSAVPAGQELSATNIHNLPGFDLSAGSMWVYPTNFPVREYQFNISQTALLNNTLVCLPTGLGKTFIAAVVMYNFYRWYPSCKIVFMAPTKPLVAQQIEACFRVMGIPQEHMAEMTGTTQAQNRKELWKNRRVFFLTPQVMVNDLTRGACPAPDIKCLVIDEAHKALGNHAYCQVVRELSNYTTQYRILALSATPGSDTRSVQQVVSNLLIAQIELRSEDSPDLQPYSHTRQLEKFVVPLGTELEAVQKAYLQILETFAGHLIRNNLLTRRDIPNLTKYQMVLSRDQFRKNPPPNIGGIQLGAVEGDFALCISLYHGYELLLQMGTRSLYYFLRAIIDGSKGMTRARNELARNADFMDLYQQLEAMFSDSNNTGANGSIAFNTSLRSDVKKPFIYSHPKLKKLEEVVVQHFKTWNKQEGQSSSNQTASDTRIMIFSSFRDSVQEIAEMLNQHHPTVSVMTFVGHSSTGKGVKGFTQKEQLEVVKRFREGGYNTLVSTCVGEEGLDIGEVDLIICFDAQKSPIRLVQRMGRTGRKRHGRIVVIISEGREERTYNQSQSNKRSIYKAILGNKQTLHFNHQSPRMVPDGINPRVHKMFITQGAYKSKDNVPAFSKDKRSSTGNRKSSIFFNAEDSMKEDWPLTHAEFNTWNTSYRLQESDEIADVILPRTHFEYFPDTEETTEATSENVRELSLTEWKLWQNRPFPTDLVDHSDRCKHFIAIMEMIEVMRHEEDGCNYDLEMMSYLHKEDVGISAKTPNDTAIHSAASSKAAKKLPNVKKGKANKIISSSSFIEPDEECMSLFKVPNSKKIVKPCTKDIESTELEVHDFGGEKGLDSEELECVDSLNYDMTDENVLSGISLRIGEPCSRNMNNNTSSDQDPGIQNHLKDTSTKLQSFEYAKADSGYQSFSEDSSSILSNMFYFPHKYTVNTVFAEFAEDKIYRLENMLSCIKAFLASSPPSISELDYLDNLEMDSEDTLPRLSINQRIFPTAHERKPLGKLEKTLTPVLETKNLKVIQTQSKHDSLQEHGEEVITDAIKEKSFNKFTNLSLLSVQKEPHTIITVDSPAQDDLNFRRLCSPNSNRKDTTEGKAGHDPHWDDIFDSDTTQIENLDDFQIDSPVQENHNLEIVQTEKEKTINSALPDDLDDSFDLFEDDTFCDLDNLSQGNSNCTDKQHLPGPGSTSVNFDMFDASVLLQDHEDTAQEMDNKICSAADNIWHDIDGERFDCSEELFSVHFDLGFSISDDGTSENEGSPNSTSEIEGEKETPLKHFRVPSPPKCNPSVIGGNMSTPLTSLNVNSAITKVSEKEISLFSPLQPVKRKNSITPEKCMSSSFLTPLIKKYKTPTSLVNSISKYEFVTPITPKSSKKKVNTSGTSHSWDVESSEMKPTKSKNDSPVSDDSNLKNIAGSGDESDEEVVCRRKRKSTKSNILASPEAASSDCDFDSPIPAAKKRKHVLDTPDSCDDVTDFKESHPVSSHESGVFSRKCHKDKKISRHKKNLKRAARQYFDDEAELSSEGADLVSSDEDVDSDNVQDSSLIGFLNDNTQLSQGLNDSEMHGIYLKSVRSPVVAKHLRLGPRKRHSMAVFSQIPEQDESYMEDSFCVDEEEEDIEPESSEEEVSVNLDLLQQDSFIEGRKQYCTRRRLKLKGATSRPSIHKHHEKKKPSRIIIHEDSSEEETDVISGVQVIASPPKKTDNLPLAARPSAVGTTAQGKGCSVPVKSALDVPLRDRCQARMNLKASVSEELDFEAENSITRPRTSNRISHTNYKEGDKTRSIGSDYSCLGSSILGDISLANLQSSLGSNASKAELCILTDSREIASGPEVISCLKSIHGVKVEVCSLGGCDYIVSNRMSVERKSQSEFANSANRSKLVERIQHLHNLFDRVCLIVEKDRVKSGDTSRIFQRTKYYDSTLSALISAGVRILFSSGQEETAGLLKMLALLEQRKNSGITVPTEVEGHKQEALQFYLSIPNINYLTALNLCHRFDSVNQMVNSSVDVISSLAQVSAQKAEDIFRYVHYVFESHMLPSDNNAKRKQM
ncbi:Fanconi anemia group M protein [Discoglossus pictus]